MAVGEPETPFVVRPDAPTGVPDNVPEPERRAEGQGQGQAPFPAKAAEGQAVAAGGRVQRRASAPKPKGAVQTSAGQWGAQDEPAVRERFFANVPPAGSKPMQFLTLDEAAQLWDTDYTVKRLLPSQGVVLLYGEPACGKSFSIFSTAVHISEGWILGRHLVRKKPVYYLALEGCGGLGKRTRAFKQWAEINGKPELSGVFLFWTHGFALNKWSDCQSLCNAIIEAGHSGAVVVIDTLSQSTLGLDENSSDMAVAVGNATRIAEAIGGLVVLVHHVGKVSTNGPRGHSSLMGNVDCAIYVTKASNGHGAEWTVKKSKDEAEGHTICFKFHVFEVGKDVDGDIVTSCAAEPCKPEKAETAQGGTLPDILKRGSADERCFKSFLAALHETKAEAVPLDDWRRVYYASSTAEPNSKRALFNRERGNLVRLGVLSVNNDVYSITPAYRRRLQAETADAFGGTANPKPKPKQGSETAKHP
jgi:hypothetical protein